jgi:hypothetical protein
MGALDHWLSPAPPQNGEPAISAISAIAPQKPQKSVGSPIAGELLPSATDLLPVTENSSEVAAVCYRSGPGNPRSFGEIAEIAEIAGAATPLGIVASKSSSPPANLDRQDWLDFYEERAAILEHDGGVTRDQAERLAYEACVVALTWELPADYAQDHCAACQTRLAPSKGLPLSDNAVICDTACHHDHMRQQRERAARQLAEWDIAVK